MLFSQFVPPSPPPTCSFNYEFLRNFLEVQHCPWQAMWQKKKKKSIKRRILNNYEFLSFYFTFTLYILYLGHFINIRRILCGHRFHFLSISCQDGRVGLIHHMCVLISQSCPILWDQMDCSLPGSSVHGISQARILEWVAISSSRGSS